MRYGVRFSSDKVLWSIEKSRGKNKVKKKSRIWRKGDRGREAVGRRGRVGREVGGEGRQGSKGVR